MVDLLANFFLKWVADAVDADALAERDATHDGNRLLRIERDAIYDTATRFQSEG